MSRRDRSDGEPPPDPGPAPKATTAEGYTRDVAGGGEASEDSEAPYDPFEREPRTFAELASFVAHWAAAVRPSWRGRVPIDAKDPDHHYLVLYCQDSFDGMSMEALVKLRARYAVQTGKTVGEIDATTLRELADHFRRQSRITANGAERPEAAAGGMRPGGTAEAPHPGKGTKGKNIDARMLKAMAADPECMDWSSGDWAARLSCAESTVRETSTWRLLLPKARAMRAAAGAERMDSSRTHPRGRRRGKPA